MDDGKRKKIFQAILETGDEGGELKKLRDELLSNQDIFKQQFVEANPEDAKRVKKYLWSIVNTGSEFVHLFTS